MKPRPLDERDLCRACDGSGEGYAPDSRCDVCKGTGIDECEDYADGYDEYGVNHDDET